MGEEWKSMTETEKEPFMKIASKDKERENVEMLEYEATLKKNKLLRAEASETSKGSDRMCEDSSSGESDGTISNQPCLCITERIAMSLMDTKYKYQRIYEPKYYKLLIIISKMAQNIPTNFDISPYTRRVTLRMADSFLARFYMNSTFVILCTAIYVVNTFVEGIITAVYCFHWGLSIPITMLNGYMLRSLFKSKEDGSIVARCCAHNLIMKIAFTFASFFLLAISWITSWNISPSLEGLVTSEWFGYIQMVLVATGVCILAAEKNFLVQTNHAELCVILRQIPNDIVEKKLQFRQFIAKGYEVRLVTVNNKSYSAMTIMGKIDGLFLANKAIYIIQGEYLTKIDYRGLKGTTVKVTDGYKIKYVCNDMRNLYVIIYSRTLRVCKLYCISMDTLKTIDMSQLLLYCLFCDTVIDMVVWRSHYLFVHSKFMGRDNIDVIDLFDWDAVCYIIPEGKSVKGYLLQESTDGTNLYLAHPNGVYKIVFNYGFVFKERLLLKYDVRLSPREDNSKFGSFQYFKPLRSRFPKRASTHNQ
eukprot:TRINITY_DN892_c0_g1_i1.p1 TRINITY_DN892_c0_g1~~TRINITY_DN892_c0_g1_i1.p1  ORF type:complete len:532 (+),score=15.63 TRINITY_DN892_c0_g1_i1:2651-4246(+)